VNFFNIGKNMDNVEDLFDFELEFALDNIVDRFGLTNVIKELEKRALKENLDFFDGKIGNDQL